MQSTVCQNICWAQEAGNNSYNNGLSITACNKTPQESKSLSVFGSTADFKSTDQGYQITLC